MQDVLTVEIWTDLICPWCWIGERRFEQALEAFPQRERVQVVRRAFRLMPGRTPEPTRQMLAKRFGSAAQAAAVLAHVEAEGRKEGLAYRLGNTLTGDTLHAHRLVKLAETVGLGERAVQHFYQAYFCDERSLFDRDSLVRLAGEIGLEPDRVGEVLDGDRFAAEVARDQRVVQAMGANGVPFFVIGGRVQVSGAQGPAAFLAALEQAWNSREPDSVDGDADVCGPDGCTVITK